ncbi:unnamed protein product [Paramecium primaurelia]|uniref:PSI domain-containing protein n=1 Tax=Paramecium primaurelia TaxID=5886 RepID=A0A8S1QHK7_PARPR|nr:unnamed protein product [Paramecium primaurelia]
MKFKLYIFFSLLTLHQATTFSTIKCTCEQLLSQNDCLTNKCTWDQNKCVINLDTPVEINTIVTYCTQFEDQICQQQIGCAWIDKQCIPFIGCSAYAYTGHEECQYISNKCISDGVHCIDLAQCQAYKTEIACVKNTNNKVCYWNIDKCQDIQECSQISKTLQSDEECRFQMSKCTVSEQSGCVDSGDACSNQKLEKQCIWDKSKSQSCAWISDKCVSRICQNAPVTYTTFEQCNEFLSTCTAQLNGGCINISSCENIKVELGCVMNMNKQPCIWIDNNCLDKQCSKAPAKFNTNELCKKINNNCITTLNGCVEQLSCESSKTQIGCIDMIDGTKCYWNGSKCVDKTCQNNTTIKTEAECQLYSNNCILNVTVQSGCLDKICENIVQAEQCTIDKFNNKCSWKSTCFTKSCNTAPKTFTTNNECQLYMNSCVLDTSGYGCMNIRLTCLGYVSEKSCLITKGGQYCHWQDKQCIDRTCSMASVSMNSTQQCQTFKPDCILSNNSRGCMDITQNCEDRKLQGNCQYGDKPICIWNINRCIKQSCETANIVGSPNYLSYFDQQSCLSYMDNCIPNNTGNGCITKPQSCTQLSINNCIIAQQNDCIWIGGQCKDKICINLIGSSHQDCQIQLSNCTVNGNLNSCIPLSYKCSSYTQQQQCYLTSNNVQCTWNGTQCRDAICSDAIDSSDYDTYEECNSLNSICTVVSKVGQQGCVEKYSTCESYNQQYQCHSSSNSIKCIWINNSCQQVQNLTCGDIKIAIYDDTNCSNILSNCKSNITQTGCINKACTDYNYTTKSDCEQLTGCTINADFNKCIIKQQKCSSYSSDSTQCKYSGEGECIMVGLDCLHTHLECNTITNPINDNDCFIKRSFCKMQSTDQGNKCIQRNCNEYIGITPTSFSICQEYDYSCINTRDNNGCIEMKQYCKDAVDASCVYAKDEGLCKYNGTNCVAVATANTKNCNLIVEVGLTLKKCQEYSNNYCSVNRSNSACVNIKPYCSEYTNIQDCYQSTSGRCIQSQQNDIGALCINIIDSTQCSKLFIGQSSIYNHSICESLKNTCTNNSNSGCKDKTCQNTNTLFTTHDQCNNWLNICTINTTNNGCIEMKQTCLEQNINSCLQAIEGQCIVYDNKCMKFTCQKLSNTLTTHTQCETINNSCTVATFGGCIVKSSNCNNYKTQLQCQFSLDGKKCWWNQYNMTCVNLQCNLIEQTTDYNTHDKCYNASSIIKCTLSSNGIGCQQLKTCTEYTIQGQCVIDKYNKQCVWNDNLNPSVCQLKSCEAASYTFTTHDECQAFDSICTVQIKYNNDTSTQNYSGCQNLNINCSDYQFEQQCYLNKNNKLCKWIDNQCIDFGCKTAPKTSDYSTHENCQSYLNTCTVNSDLLGCMTIPNNCSDIFYEIQCIKDINNNDCYWYDSKCQLKTCENAPNDKNTKTLCEQWLPQCTAEDTNKCKTITCEDYPYTTDLECRQQMSYCTTDGIKCVTKGSCAQALSEIACDKSINNEQCYWNKTYCNLKQCNIITKEIDCNNSYNNIQCIWDNNKCRNIGECYDYNGTSHKECQSINKLCTIDDNKKCRKIRLCNDYSKQTQCILGLDGPCLWIQQLNICHQYTSCNSIKFQTHNECQQISKLCTTDGLQCVPLTLCSETNTNGGCVEGIDGSCMQTVPALNSIQPPICKLFTSCLEAYYITHNECQNANKNCTTNAISGCINLMECSQYQRQESCQLDINGVQYQDNLIVSTGKCIWDNGLCRNQICSDFSGITNEQCNKFLSTCTFNGVKCIPKQNCYQYTSSTMCGIAYGIEGKCNWNVALDKCLKLTCDDIQNGTTLALCQKTLSNCITNGVNCINKDTCSRYITKIACNVGGTDGICVWNAKTSICSLMMSCTQADNDQEACLQASDRCAIKYATSQSTSSCYTHTCETYLNSNGLCKSFYNWNYSSKTACSFSQGKCAEIDLSTLTEQQCLTTSEYSFTWNTNKNICQSCIAQPNNNNNNNSNQTNTSQDIITPTQTIDFGYMIQSIMYLYLISN